jgi:hypothetical protein
MRLEGGGREDEEICVACHTQLPLAGRQMICWLGYMEAEKWKVLHAEWIGFAETNLSEGML